MFYHIQGKLEGRPIYNRLFRKKVQKIQILTPNIGVVYSGMGPDSRVLVRKSRKQAKQYYRLYKEPIPVTQLVRETATVMQEFTQSGNVFSMVLGPLVYLSWLLGMMTRAHSYIRWILQVHTFLGKLQPWEKMFPMQRRFWRRDTLKIWNLTMLCIQRF